MKKNTSTGFFLVGSLLFVIGILFSITIIGATIGIPMLITGSYFLHKADELKIKEGAEQRAFDEENAEKMRRAIADGIAEGLRKARDVESTTVSISKEETDK